MLRDVDYANLNIASIGDDPAVQVSYAESAFV
jgi:hypothetical protein